MTILTGIIRKVFSIYCALVVLIGFDMPGWCAKTDHSGDTTNYPYVFVHGFFGWGEYDEANKTMPYWGLSTGDDIETFNKGGYTAAAATVDPVGSAWDRACELYAQLTGTVVDYGKAHSEKYEHERYGEDFTGRALIEKWDAENKINIVSHSFGGPTCALFASILEYGAEEEIAATTDGSISGFFTGGKGDRIYSITGIAGAYNGTGLCVVTGAVEDFINCDSEMKGDDGLYDMHPDNAAKLNETIKSVDSIYYFTVPCCTTYENEKGKIVPDAKITDLQFFATGVILGAMNTVTDGGIALDETWQPNDGVVNTISEIGPFNAEFNFVNASPSAELAKTGFRTGVYNVFETYSGAHMAVLGNITLPNKDGRSYLLNLMQMVNAL